MQNQTKHSKYIRIYNKKYNSFRKLKDKDFFSFVYKTSKNMAEDNQEVNFRIFFEVIIVFVSQINPKDKVTKEFVASLVSDQFEILTITHGVQFEEEIINETIDRLYFQYSRGEERFLNFRGEVLEFLYVYLEKDSDHKIYHEPFFYHKRRRIIKEKSFPGSSCLIDVVKLNAKKHDIVLTECKATLDNHTKQLRYRASKFSKKLRFMNEIERLLSSYTNVDGRNIHVNKVLATINEPVLPLPQKYKRYMIINLLDKFILTVS